MRILYLRQCAEGKRVLIALGDREAEQRYSVSVSLYEELGHPTVGDELDGEAIRAIVLDDEKYRAMKKALSLLGYSDKNQKTLFLRLKSAGFSTEASSDTVRQCVALGYIDEQRQLQRLIMKEASLLRGPRLIASKLAAKGYGASSVRSAMDKLCQNGELDFSSNLSRLYRRLDARSDEERRAVRYKYGF